MAGGHRGVVVDDVQCTTTTTPVHEQCGIPCRHLAHMCMRACVMCRKLTRICGRSMTSVMRREYAPLRSRLETMSGPNIPLPPSSSKRGFSPAPGARRGGGAGSDTGGIQPAKPPALTNTRHRHKGQAQTGRRHSSSQGWRWIRPPLAASHQSPAAIPCAETPPCARLIRIQGCLERRSTPVEPGEA